MIEPRGPRPAFERVAGSVASEGNAGDRGYRRFEPGAAVTFKDAPGTQVTIGGNQAQKQADLLKLLCDKGAATCTFNPTGEEHVLSDDRVLTDYAFTNPYKNEASYTWAAADTTGSTDSLGFSLSGTLGFDFLEKAEVTLTATYGHTWENSHTASKQFTVNVPPYCTITPTHKAPMIKDTGDFIVKLGNTTWHVNDVVWYSPDTTDEARVGSWSYTETPVSSTQRAASSGDACGA